MRNALVTGGAGFIGSTLVQALAADPEVERVVVVDNLSTGKRENLEGIAGSIEFHRIDIRDNEALGPVFAGVDTVFHEAAIASVSQSIAEPRLCHEVNVDGTFNVLMAAREAGVRRFVFAASSSAYGDSPELPKRETMPPAPLSPYAVHKLAGEYYLKVFHKAFGLETVALRYFNVFGPRQDPKSSYSGVLSAFAKGLLAGRAPTIHGDGEQTRDFIFVDDIVRLNLLAARAAAAPGKVYNGGRGERISINRAWRCFCAIGGVDLPAARGPERVGDPRDSEADISAARRELGFEPQVTFEEGLRRTLEWMRG